jgi:hypothetical protein
MSPQIPCEVHWINTLVVDRPAAFPYLGYLPLFPVFPATSERGAPIRHIFLPNGKTKRRHQGEALGVLPIDCDDERGEASAVASDVDNL